MAHFESSYEPDYAVSPGSVLSEILEARGISQAEFARRCRRSSKLVSEIISGRAPIEPQTAIQFERVLGVNAPVWLNLESNYRLALANQEEKKRLEAVKAAPSATAVRRLTKLGFIRKPKNKLELLREWLSFLGSGTPEAWESNWNQMNALLRHSPAYKSDPDALAAWLRMGEIAAEKQECRAYNRERFLNALNEVRNLALHNPDESILSSLRGVCNNAGVAFVVLPSFPKAHVSGSARWLSKRPVICQTLRHRYEDHFWFTFFHEAAHVLLHGKKDIFLDDVNDQENVPEREANKFAEKCLLSNRAFESFCRDPITEERVVLFAAEHRISPGIVVERLQNRGIIGWHEFSKLKRKIEIDEERLLKI